MNDLQRSAVLREFKQVKQERGPGSRRWFESDGFDVVFWFDAAGSVDGFQICYDFGGGEHALTWRRCFGCVHSLIDAGDSDPLRNESPILVPDGAVPWARLLNAFDARSALLDPSLRRVVREQLQGGEPCSAAS